MIHRVELLEEKRFVDGIHPTKCKFNDHGFRSGRKFWKDKTLYDAATEQKCKIGQFPVKYIDQSQNRWVGCDRIVDVAYHCRRIVEADLTQPVLLSPNGMIMDGYHRVCKALVFGQSFFYYMRLKEMPPPDKTDEEEEEGS